jgi:hypothetical protein
MHLLSQNCLRALSLSRRIAERRYLLQLHHFNRPQVVEGRMTRFLGLSFFSRRRMDFATV